MQLMSIVEIFTENFSLKEPNATKVDGAVNNRQFLVIKIYFTMVTHID